ncbi:nitroreductase family protein [Legionella fallonii]|uniref:Nitroreductase n=1 Tax=Legionella fallonii LLAP-10 TaxID=1212491 RepID=A0A098G5L8_9GAMM|nr:nitroreductase family protein [Legionella fallonii]CEG57271.1 Nitroreductase [Legionella fallonii LLAP-10]
MDSSKTINHNKISLNVMDVIYNRRAVRDYLPQKIDQDLIHTLLNAAIQAPTAMHEEPWSFVIIQNKDLLNHLSESTKHLVLTETKNAEHQQAKHIIDLVKPADFNVFYNAETLIIIYSKFYGDFVAADCWLATENLMLAAHANGLGTCVIGFAVKALNTPEWKDELGIPAEMTAIAPIIVGWPAGKTPPSPRKPPEILIWK